jgi:hypothetical protein
MSCARQTRCPSGVEDLDLAHRIERVGRAFVDRHADREQRRALGRDVADAEEQIPDAESTMRRDVLGLLRTTQHQVEPVAMHHRESTGARPTSSRR